MNEYALISLIAAMTAFFIANFIYFRNPKNHLNRMIALLSLVVSLMALAEFSYRLAETPETAYFWLKFSVLWPLIPSIMLHISLIFTNRTNILKNPFSPAIIYAPAFIFIGLGIFTNSFLAAPVYEYWGWTYGLPQDRVVYDLFSLWTVIVALLSSSMVFIEYWNARDIEKTESLYIFLGLFFPLVVSLFTDYLLRDLSIKIPELTQTMITMGLVLIAYGIWKYKFPLLTPTLAAEKIISTMPNFLILTNKKGNITRVNKSILHNLGYHEHELINRPYYLLFSPENTFSLERSLGEYMEHQSRIIARDGSEFDVIVSVSPIFSLKELTGFVIIGTDISERNKALSKIMESEFKFRSVVEQTSDGVALADKTGKIIYWNHALEEITGYKKEDVINIPLSDVLYELMSEENKKKISREKLKKVFFNVFKNKRLPEKFKMDEKEILRSDGSSKNVHVVNFFVEKSNPPLMCTVITDMTEHKDFEDSLKSFLAEKEVLLKEIHHRVKNNLQIISSLLSLQSSYVNDEKALDLFKDSQNRVKSMAMIHESLYQSQDLASIDFSRYITRMATELFSSYADNVGNISLRTDVEDVHLEVDTAIPCGLIINELLTNSIKYAFPSNQAGQISIKFYQNEECYHLHVIDNGVGFPEDFDFRNTRSLGMKLVTSLVDQLDGTIQLKRGSGTEFIISFTELVYEPRL